MLKLNEHLVSVLAQAIVYFVQKHNCRSLIKDIIVEIVETGSEMDTYSQDQSSHRTFSSFIVEITAQEPELVLPCVNFLTPNLNCDVSQLIEGSKRLEILIPTSYFIFKSHTVCEFAR